jgi:hypothetical protein
MFWEIFPSSGPVHSFAVQPCFDVPLLSGCYTDPLRNIIPRYLLGDQLAP